MQRKVVAASLSSPDIATEKTDLEKAKRILKVFEANGGKLPATFKMEDLDGAEDDEAASTSTIPPSVQAALAGVFAYLRMAARANPQLCVEPLEIMNTLVSSLDPQSMLNEKPETLRAMHGFFSSLCTEEMAAAASLGADIPETKLVPASLSGLLSLAIARGDLTAFLNATAAMLDHVGKLADGSSLRFPLPTPLLTLAKVAKGDAAAAGAAVIPSADTKGPVINLNVDGAAEGALGVGVALAVSGPYAYVLCGGLDTLVKVGTGIGSSVRGKVYASVSGVMGRLTLEGGSASPSLQESLLWIGVVNATTAKPVVVVREQSMKPGLLVAFDGTDLLPAGVLREALSSVLRAGRELEESKGAVDEADAKLAASLASGSGSDLIGLGAAAIGAFDDTSFVVCDVHTWGSVLLAC